MVRTFSTANQNCTRRRIGLSFIFLADVLLEHDKEVSVASNNH
jgi:hypothetical protein